MSKAAQNKFSRVPVFWLAACFGLGILLAKAAPLSLAVSLVIAAIAAAVALLLRSKQYAGIFIAIAFTAAGAVSFSAQLAAIRSDRLKVLYDSGTYHSGTPVEVEGVLASAPEPSFDGAFLLMATDATKYRGQEAGVSGRVRVFVPETTDPHLKSEISNLKYGSRVRVACALKREDEYLNPGVQSKREILDRQDIDATCSVKSAALIEHRADESVFIPLAWVFDQRAALIEGFRSNLSPSAAGVMIASLLGDKYFLDKDTAELFREGGTFHILVISGLHITFIGGLLLLFLRRLTRNRWLQFGVTTSVLWAYTLAVGADVPVVRAAVMFTIVLFAYAIYRPKTLLNSFGLSCLVLLVWRPQDLFNPSFQLTVVSVAAIVCVAYPLLEHLRSIGTWTPTVDRPFPPNVPPWLVRICETVHWRADVWTVESKRNIWRANVPKHPHAFAVRIGTFGRKVVRYLFDGVVVSLIVQTAMLPLSVVYFHRVAFGGIVLNIWVGALIAVESFAAVIGALADRVSSLLAGPFFALAEFANWLMLTVPRFFSWAEWSSFRVPAYSGDARILYILFFIPLGLLAIWLSRWDPFSMRRARVANFALAVVGTFLILLAIVVFHPFSAPRPDGRLHVDFLDVGQGDSIFLTFPDGETWLVDGGGKFDPRKSEEADAFEPDRRSIGESVVSEVLWAKGYSHIDRIIATHADADHIQGLNDVAGNFSVGAAIFGRTPHDDPEFAELAEVLDKRRLPIRTTSRGDRYEIGGATVEVLFPLRTVEPNSVSDNNHSVVVRIVYGSRAILLTGDIERQAEMQLTAGGGRLAADVVKVAHHGSRTSSTAEFIAASHPQYAVISVGRHSPFGHPHEEVVTRWQNAGASVLTTGENGMISISTDGKDLQISRFTGGRAPLPSP